MKKKAVYNTKEYVAWTAMKQRCLNPKHPCYKHYGKRGIFVCKRWLLFKNFFGDLGSAPKGYSLERINNEKGYFPSNCKWATWKEQLRNRRVNRILKYRGKSLFLDEWAKIVNLPRSTIDARLFYGWSIEEALTVPKNKRVRFNVEVFLTYKRKTLYLKQWAKLLGINYHTLKSRWQKGYPIKMILSKKLFKKCDISY